MKTLRAVPVLLYVVTFAACSHETEKQLTRLAFADSIHVDSLGIVRQQLLEAVATSDEFLNDVNNELAQARFLIGKPTVMGTAEIADPNLERNLAVMKVGNVVARLDSVEKRLSSARVSVAQLSKKDSELLAKVAEFERNIADLQTTAEAQRVELQAVIDGQTTQIAGLTTHIGALKDSVGRLTNEKNVAYVVIGTRAELIKKGVLVPEGSRRFLVAGSRAVKPARALDPAAFTRIDRTVDRTIVLPAGKYQIISRQNPAYATSVSKTGSVVGLMTIEQPEQFWEASPFLIIVRT
jgi:hypothetical protein